VKKTSSFAIADKNLKSSTAGPLLGAVTCEQIAKIDSGTVQAVLIDSDILGGPIWFSFFPEFNPRDGVPVFYADELCLLKDRPLSTLRRIMKQKRPSGWGHGCAINRGMKDKEKNVQRISRQTSNRWPSSSG
jgi:hypothetical protein